MIVTVRLYGAPRVALHCRERQVALHEDASVADLVAELIRQLGPRANDYFLDSQGRGYVVAFAVNGAIAQPNSSLRDGDLVSLMPPTAGGSNAA